MRFFIIKLLLLICLPCFSQLSKERLHRKVKEPKVKIFTNKIKIPLLVGAVSNFENEIVYDLIGRLDGYFEANSFLNNIIVPSFEYNLGYKYYTTSIGFLHYRTYGIEINYFFAKMGYLKKMRKSSLEANVIFTHYPNAYVWPENEPHALQLKDYTFGFDIGFDYYIYKNLFLELSNTIMMPRNFVDDKSSKGRTNLWLSQSTFKVGYKF